VKTSRFEAHEGPFARNDLADHGSRQALCTHHRCVSIGLVGGQREQKPTRSLCIAR
jgi:hypothetical protein